MSVSAMNRALLLALFSASSGCAPTIQLEVLKPSEVALPADIKTIAVIDRSRPTNLGQGILGTLEGALTGEAIGADRDAGKEAVSVLARTLTESPLYEAVVPTFDREGQDSNLFDKELEWSKVRTITRAHGAQALVSLEALDSDSSVTTGSYTTTETNDEGREVNRIVHTAERETQVLTAWRVYYPKTPSVVDDLRNYAQVRTWTYEGNSEEEARGGLPAQRPTVIELGGISGAEYGRRIAPFYMFVSRTYFNDKDARMKQAANHVKARNWTEAAKLWRDVAKAGDPKLRGKAKFNLALYNEVEGRLKKGFEWAQEAAVDFPKGKTRNYVSILSGRLEDQRRLEEQMKKAAEEAEKARESLAVPAGDNGTMTRPDSDSKDGTMTRPDSDSMDGTMTRPDSDSKDGTMTRPDSDSKDGTMTRPK